MKGINLIAKRDEGMHSVSGDLTGIYRSSKDATEGAVLCLAGDAANGYLRASHNQPCWREEALRAGPTPWNHQ